MKPGNDFHLLTWEARGDERANWELELKWFPLPLPLLYCMPYYSTMEKTGRKTGRQQINTEGRKKRKKAIGIGNRKEGK
jgi:hypothetical protein